MQYHGRSSFGKIDTSSAHIRKQIRRTKLNQIAELNIDQIVATETVKAIALLFDVDIPVANVQVQKTRKEFEGDRTIVVFPFVKMAKSKPEELGAKLGEAIVAASETFIGFNVVKGFLNLEVSPDFWMSTFTYAAMVDNYGFQPQGTGKSIMVEYSSPNTNKPLHLGHLRNNFLGYSVAEILKANGNKVSKVQIINDRGIHICKSMIAWQRFGNGETPESSGLKGDKLVGKYYVAFDKAYKEEIAQLLANGLDQETAEKQAPIYTAAQEMLRQWEAKDPEVYELWQTMNSWVYQGFEVTYKTMGVDFDKLYYESETYLYGKEVVMKGVESGAFYQKEDGSIWVDLTADGLDQKLLLRADGTAVYMTQDIGTAILRYEDQQDLSQLIYTVGNEQEYHFKVLFLILEKLGYSWAKECYHLSYGMVDLPSGKMKSREGTVVDADDLMADMSGTAKEITEELGKLEGSTEEEKELLYHQLGNGALKYYLLKVDPVKQMMFDPLESIDFNGNTGPFIQYAYARICSLLRRGKIDAQISFDELDPNDEELGLIHRIYDFPATIKESAENYSPALLANYLFDLVKTFNHFYQTQPIFKEEDELIKQFRLSLSKTTGDIIKRGMKLLGVSCPDRM
jgi:arginyl-tRNA synthetase